MKVIMLTYSRDKIFSKMLMRSAIMKRNVSLDMLICDSLLKISKLLYHKSKTLIVKRRKDA